jgi:hypothetical protein
MALDIGVDAGSSLGLVWDEPTLCLQDDALYWFLHPLFERLRAQTSQYVDLYGDASFEGASLQALRKMLAQARSLAESRPETWEVHVGTQLAPVLRELWKPVDRKTLLNLIAQWERVVARADGLGRPVVCIGD